MEYTKKRLAQIIEKHGKWIDGEEGGEPANLRGANLRRANLSMANLRMANLLEANLRMANLRRADLRGANLNEANLRYANLSGADLRGANLSEANLLWADLSGADLSYIRSLWSTTGNGKEIKTVQADTWDVTYTATHMQIDYQLHTIEEWWAFSDDQIAQMDGEALRWWGVWKPILMNIIDVSPATPYAIKDEEE